MKVCVTGATGFVGAHVARGFCGPATRSASRCGTARRLRALEGPGGRAGPRRRPRPARPSGGRWRAASCSSTPPGWSRRARSARSGASTRSRPGSPSRRPRQAGLRRVVVTSSVGARRPGARRPAGERAATPIPRTAPACSTPTPSTRARWRPSRPAPALGIDVVAVNPAYVLGAGASTARCRARPRRGSSATTCAAGCRRSSTPTPTSSTSRTSRRGICWRPAQGKPGERYILGGENLRWSEVIERVARAVGRRATRCSCCRPRSRARPASLQAARRAVRDRSRASA